MANNNSAFEYQLLARLQQDCEYYLGFGALNRKHLWALDEAEQIQKMKELYAGLPEKPEWITLEDIEKYEAAMVAAHPVRCDHMDTPADLAVFRESRAMSPVGEAMRKHLKL